MFVKGLPYFLDTYTEERLPVVAEMLVARVQSVFRPLDRLSDLVYFLGLTENVAVLNKLEPNDNISLGTTTVTDSTILISHYQDKLTSSSSKYGAKIHLDLTTASLSEWNARSL